MNTGWRKATFSSDNASCVKVRFDGPHILFGDTKNAHLGDQEPILRLPHHPLADHPAPLGQAIASMIVSVTGSSLFARRSINVIPAATSRYLSPTWVEPCTSASAARQSVEFEWRPRRRR